MKFPSYILFARSFFLPSGLFVVVSWISFVVPPDVIPGRMALLITLFLVLVNIFNNVTTNTPKAKGKQVPLHFFLLSTACCRRGLATSHLAADPDLAASNGVSSPGFLDICKKTQCKKNSMRKNS